MNAGGSKTVPATGGSPGNGLIINKTLQLVLFVVFMASSASTFSSYWVVVGVASYELPVLYGILLSFMLVWRIYLRKFVMLALLCMCVEYLRCLIMSVVWWINLSCLLLSWWISWISDLVRNIAIYRKQSFKNKK